MSEDASDPVVSDGTSETPEARSASSREKPRRRRRWKLLLISLLIAFGIGELISTYLMRNVAKSPLIYAADPYTSFALQPNTVETHASPEYRVTYRINAQGLRGAPVELPKPSSRTHVLLLGDSFVFGWGVEDEETVGSRLEERLTQGSEMDVRVINAGFACGTAPDDAYAFLASERGHALEPDVIIQFVFLGNDYRDIDGHEWARVSPEGLPLQVRSPTDFPNELHGRGPIPFYKSTPILRDLNLVQLAGRAWFVLFELPSRLERINKDTARRMEAGEFLPDRMRLVMAGMAREARDRGAHLLWALIPAKQQTRGEPSAFYDRALEALQAELEAQGIPHTTLSPERGVGPEHLFPGDGHWSARGHEAVAAELERMLAESGIIGRR